MRDRTFTFGLVAGALLAFTSASAQQASPGSPARATVELFTSQGCYSCPPADDLLRELIDRRPDVVALEFHVDYWDELVYGDEGKWRDPFSSADFTKRQRDYHAGGVEGRRGVYTPQMIVNGERALVGADRDAMALELRNARRLPLEVRIRSQAGGLRVMVQGNGDYEGPADIYRVDLLPSARTPIRGGENSGKLLENHNIVTGMEHIGRWWGASPDVRIEPPDHDATTCAVLVQEPSGLIVGAAYCPS
ncbi:MAG: DUF1223 domain-containing protein [Proteobacteria bacterium]|nr:MAG: DUF1223 domain-containing protein [Pseudomonadota bacterium]